ncbi:MAG: cytochrome c [Gemmatimonadetes bacterium]|nr:cytochrome c [Gemmatimonadota bacterium]
MSAWLAACSGTGDGAATTHVSRTNGGPPPGQHFELGRAATPAEVAALDLDVNPAGAGLPAGRGSASDGAKVYARACASCHGPNGEGIAPLYPQLVGRDPAGETFDFAKDPRIARTIGNYWPYATTVFDYIRRAMPQTAPGSLSADDTYAVTAYLLAANKVIGAEAVLDSAALVNVKMPARDRFVRDDRRGGHEVR